MEKMFGPMMRMFMGGREADGKPDMKACFKKMSSMCPSCAGDDDASGDSMKAMMEKMMSFCCGRQNGSEEGK